MKTLILLITILVVHTSAIAQPLKATVGDVGAGLCVIIEIPSDQPDQDSQFMIFDAGPGCIDHVNDIIPTDDDIDLLVLSHNDSDHISNADNILEEYQVNKIIWSGFERPGVGTYDDLVVALENEPGAEIINLGDNPLPLGTTWIYGNTYVTFVSGFSVPPVDWGFTPSMSSEYRNAGSIVMRVTNLGKSILMTGDMIGRHETDHFPEDGIIAAEAFVLKNRFAVPIDSDVLIASHHGGNDASSYPFIKTVSPEYVIFPAGSRDNFGHPRATTAQRFLNFGVKAENIFRTDRDDDEDNEKHWEPNGNTGINDPSGDDSISISITEEGVISVEYKN